MQFYWEFGGGDTVTIVSYGSVKEWQKGYSWAVERRKEILDRVAKEVIRLRGNDGAGNNINTFTPEIQEYQK